MSEIAIEALRDDLPFGARITGVDWGNVREPATRGPIHDAFLESGVLVFSGVESNAEMQVEIASIFGPLRHHAMAEVGRADVGAAASLTELYNHPEDQNIVEIDGKLLAGRTEWHWDACYAPQIYRGGVIRALDMPGEGGETGFADGIQLYRAISDDLRNRFEDLEVVYDPGLMFDRQKFGLPAGCRFVVTSPSMHAVASAYEDAPRAIHPAVWQRATGEKVLHVSPWQAAGIAGKEDAEGDALLEDLCLDMLANMRAYYHAWGDNEIIVWDNWRMIHMVSGHDPGCSRKIHRATIEGDYGLGRPEFASAGD